MLSIPKPPRKDDKDWNIRSWVNPERANASGDVLKVTYPAKGIGMDAGCGFYAEPFGRFPHDAGTLTYEVFVPADFEFVKGGKLPGLSVGAGDQCATGGDWKDLAGSVRLMWREGGEIIGYVYLPLESKSRDAVIKAQSAAFRSVADVKGKYGIDVGHGKGLAIVRGKWNEISVSVDLNSGTLVVVVNGKTLRVDGMIYRRSKSIGINAVLFSTFFGGSTDDWAPSKTQTLSFRNFSFRGTTK